MGHHDEVIAEIRKAMQRRPNDSGLQFSLASALHGKGRLDEAIVEYRKVVASNPNGMAGHMAFFKALAESGQWDEAITEYREANRLFKILNGIDRPSAAAGLAVLEKNARLDRRLAGVLAGKDHPKDAAEWLEFAQLCPVPFRQQYAGAARLFGEAFTRQPALAEDLQAAHRYNAACAAALAGCGQGKDAGKLDDKERTRLREQALGWLRADLAAWGRLLEKEPQKARPVVIKKMQHWLADSDFAGVRGPEALARLPEEERQGWQKLWSDVSGMLTRAQEKKSAKKSEGK
jgi:serine/threonine-protein kinase